MGKLETANKQVVQRYWDALAQRDWDSMKELLTDDAHYTDVGVPGPGGTGPDGVIARLRIGLEPLEGYDHLPGSNMIAEGDLVMTEHTERWTFHTGEVIDHSFVSVTQSFSTADSMRDSTVARAAISIVRTSSVPPPLTGTWPLGSANDGR